MSYRGYFDEAEANAEAARLAAEGDDVYIGGVPAYSTLGWFDDPVLSSFVRYPDTALARLVFHELAHQVVYAKDDTEFNESFATAVEEAGVARWIARQSDQPQHAALVGEQARGDAMRAEFRRLMRETRPKLAAVYASDLSDAEKLRAEARGCFGEMRDAYDAAKAGEASLGASTAGSPGTRARASTTRASRRSGCTTTRFRHSERCCGGERRSAAVLRRVRALAAKPRQERNASLRRLPRRRRRPRGSGDHPRPLRSGRGNAAPRCVATEGHFPL